VLWADIGVVNDPEELGRPEEMNDVGADTDSEGDAKGVSEDGAEDSTEDCTEDGAEEIAEDDVAGAASIVAKTSSSELEEEV
jgi:hypothetical protein